MEPTESATASAEPTTDASAEPTASPSVEPASASPSELPSASPSAEPSDEPSPEPTPSVEVTPLPGGTIEIASNVEIVGNTAAYSPDGKRFAFTARPANGKAGPDVFVWTVGDPKAHAVTTDHCSLFAGWLGADALVNRVTADGARTSVLSLKTGDETPAHDGAMWRPTVDPDGTMGVWWDGTVAATGNGLGWAPKSGRLVLEPWPAGDAEPQVLATTGLSDWQAQWDRTGQAARRVDVDRGPRQGGRSSACTPSTRRPVAPTSRTRSSTRLPAFAGFSMRNGRLTWSAPADGGDQTVQVLAWKGDTFGRFEILSDGSTTVVR